MPEDLFAPVNLEWVFALFAKVDAMRMHFYDQCLSTRYEVNNVPLKPDPAKVEEKYQDILAESRDGMANFFPKKIVPINIGSNAGLIEVVRNVWNEHKASANAHHYKFIVADTNIFWRSIKVISNKF